MPIGFKRSLLLASAIACATGSLCLWFLFFTLYWPFRGRFDGAGRFFDEAGAAVYHEQSGLLVLPAVALLLLAGGCGFISWRSRRRQGL